MLIALGSMQKLPANIKGWVVGVWTALFCKFQQGTWYDQAKGCVACR